MVRYLLSAFIIIHGLIHFLGFASAFAIVNTPALTGHISRPAGMVWLAATVMFAVSGARAFAVVSWWRAGIVAIVLSQILIISVWEHASWGTVANTIILCAAITNLASWRFRTAAHQQARELLKATSRVKTSMPEDQLSKLPEPVRRWLAHCGALEHEHIYSVRLRQRGVLRMSEAGKWMEMTAEQYFNTDKPSFLWLANIKYGMTHIAGCDVYRDGKGNMSIKIASMMTVADAKGIEADQGTMLRYLAEIQWFPSAAVSPHIIWHPVDELTAEAEMNYAGKGVKGTFHFSSEGDITAFEAKRYMEHKGSYSLETWYVPVADYKVFEGVRVPSKGSAIWKLKTGDFNWFNWEITSIDYNYSAPYAD